MSMKIASSRGPAGRLFPAAIALLLLGATAGLAVSADDMIRGLADEKGDDEVADMLGLPAGAADLGRLDVTHLSVLAGWQHVQNRGDTNGPFHWKEEGGLVRPLGGGPIRTLIRIPENGKYRLYLRRQFSLKAPRPVTLSLLPQEAAADGKTFTDSGAPLKLVFGKVQLAPGQLGRLQEKNLPVRFESETQLIAAPPEPVMAWEYADLDLKAGPYAAVLDEAAPEVRLHALLISQSAGFRPSFASFESDKTLGRLYMRFRATGDAKSPVTAEASAGYHWGPREEDSWSWPIGRSQPAPAGEWSSFVEATDALVNGPGPWSTCWIRFDGLRNGTTEVQFAWHPSEKGVLHTVRTGVGNGTAMLRVPNGDWTAAPSAAAPVWGVWAAARTNAIQTQEAVIARYFSWAEAAAQRLGLRPDHPRPRRIRLFSGCGVPEPNRARASEMLARLGINWIDGAPESVRKQFNLIDERSAWHGSIPREERDKVTKMKLGDEIGTRTDAAAINGDLARRRAFHAYLSEQAKREGLSLIDFLGAEDLSDIDCLDALPPNPGRYERRLFYHSQRFAHLVTCEGYRRQVEAIEKALPNAKVYNNYSPHPLFLTGTTMNESDWFVLPRNKAQTLGWAEDWATGGGWGLGTAYQCTSFYAALIDCAVRKHGYPAGFYVGSNCGGSAQKIFGCVAQGVTWLHLYDWGPIDRWADGSNAWSEHEGEYYAVMAAAYALGPADEIIGAGRREPRRTAILYNRSHEILQGGLGRANHDWMWTFLALKHSQVPVDVIIEEDLNPEDLKRYDVIFVGGLNLARYHVAELRRWVEAGGLLIGTAGAASLDTYNDPLPEAVALFGARQKAAGPADAGTTASVVFPASAWFPAIELKTPHALFRLLEPAGGTPLAAFADGRCAAVANTVGKGNTLLLGFQPGFAYRDNGKAYAPVRDWLAAPVLKRLGRRTVEFDGPQTETTLFEHESGLAVMLADFAWPSRATNGFLSVRTERAVKEVTSALSGPLEWKRNGDRIDITTRPLKPVDVVILK